MKDEIDKKKVIDILTALDIHFNCLYCHDDDERICPYYNDDKCLENLANDLMIRPYEFIMQAGKLYKKHTPPSH